VGEFGAINTALSALQAQQRALETTGQNVANANTDGYSRQRVRLASVGSATTPAFFARGSGTGGGVAVQDVERISDRFLELRAIQEHATDASLQQTNSILGRVELAFAEPGDNGLQAQMSNFWSSWDDVANAPDDLAARSQLLESAQTVVTGFHTVASDLDSLKQSSLEQAGNDVAQVNDLAARIAQLNQGIQSAVNGGLQPNDLLDQRGVLLQQLTSLVGVTTQDGPNQMVNVFIGGTALVRASTAATMHLDNTGPVSFRWDTDNSVAAVNSGSDGGLLQAINVDIPKYRDAVNNVATLFRNTVNAQHEQGVDLNNAPSGTPGGADLIFPGGTTGTVDAATISVNPAITPDKIAAAAVNAGKLDGSNALTMAELASSATGPDQAYRSLVDNLGVDVQRAGIQADIQTQITQQTDNARQAVSGVNIDEEMTNMMQFQHAYEAAARFLTSVDSNLDTLIHATGLVGR
jgi:flagellar hook-associated protein 1 FlgK